MGALWANVCNFARKMIKTINSWRGLASLNVVMFHCNTGIWSAGQSGVVFFFLSSAFLLSMKYPFNSLTPRQYGRFFLNHAARIYPLHWLALALMIILTLTLAGGTVNWCSAALNALLVQAWFPQHEVRYGINPVVWFLGVLIFCYLFYPLVAHWLRNWRLRYKVLLGFAISVVLAVILVPLDIPGRELVLNCPLSHLPEVIAGLSLFHLYKVLKCRYPRVSYGIATLLELSALLLVVAFITLSETTTLVKPWEDDLLWILPEGLLLLTFVYLDGQEGAIGRFLSHKVFQWLGDICFEVFILQFVVFQLYNYVFAPLAGHYGYDIYGKRAILVWPLLFAFCWMVNRLFTRPVRRWLKKALAN